MKDPRSPASPTPARRRGGLATVAHRVPVMWVLGTGMVALGLTVGLVFPAFATAMGVPGRFVHTPTFRSACLGAGLALAGANWCLARCIVGRRLRRLSRALGSVTDSVVRVSSSTDTDHARAVLSALRLPPGARDDLGAAARSFNALLGSLDRERRFREVIHAGRDVTVMVDVAGVVVFASSSVQDVLGFPADAVVGARVLDAVHPEDQDRVRALWEGTASRPATPGDDVLVVRVTAADGRTRSLELSVGDHRDDPVLAALVLTGRDVTDRVRLQAELSHQAVHDVLTGLPNRAALLRRAGRLAACTPPVPVAVALMDLDRFKEVNDTLGHDYGDRLLAQVGPRLQAQMRPGDLLVRLGGDEFAVLMVDVTPAAALGVARRARASLQQPFDVDGMLLEVDASVGVACSVPTGPDGPDAAGDDGAGRGSVHDLLRMADVAMYAAKELQTGVEQYDAGVDGNDRSRLTLLTELRRALACRELVLHYQPKLNLSDGTVAGVEALVRWQHPTRGLLAPSAFLPTVERTGLIWPLTLEVLDQALAQVGTWRAAGHDVQVAVNLSARCLHRSDLAGQVLDRLASHGVPAHLLRLELTESALMAEPERALEHLQVLADAGVRLSIDDFGTGYSSMSYLRRLPVDELKVDRSFVADIATRTSDDVLVRSIVDLGHSLGLTIVAEGVEEASTHTSLRNLRCDVGQGYLYARPQPADDVTAWLQAHHAEAVVATATDPVAPALTHLPPVTRRVPPQQDRLSGLAPR